MACINPNDPEFKKILKQVGGNPLLAAIEFNKLYPEEGAVESEVIKPGVAELFDSNPELANAVYEALEFKQNNNMFELSKEVQKELDNTNNSDDFKYNDKIETAFIVEIDEKERQKLIEKLIVKKGLLITGQPVKLNAYHGTFQDIDAYLDLEKSGLELGEEDTDSYKKGVKYSKPAVFATSSKEIAETYSKNDFGKKVGKVENVIVDFKNPLVINARNTSQTTVLLINSAIIYASENGYDSVIIKNINDSKNEDWDLGVANTYIGLNSKTIGKEPTSQITPQQKQQAQQQYSQYLDTIFPDSKEKDIVYHGTPDDIQEFDKTKSQVSDVLYFSNDKKDAEDYRKRKRSKIVWTTGVFEYNGFRYTYKYDQDKKEYYYLKKDVNIGSEKLDVKTARTKYEITEKEFRDATDKVLSGGKVVSSLLNIKNLYQGVGEDLFFGGSEYFKEKGYDGFITNDDGGRPSIFAVFEPEQIHILGSKQDIEGFKEFVDKSTFKQLELDPEMSNYIADQISKAFNVPIPGMEKDTLITAEEIENFNRDVENRDGRLPSEYFTGIDDVNKWVLNKSELYDLVDKDTGEIYLKDVNLSTGQVEKQEVPSQPVSDKERQEAIDYLNNAVKDFRIDEILAERGYDVNDIISNLASAENKEEFDKIINKLLRLLC